MARPHPVVSSHEQPATSPRERPATSPRERLATAFLYLCTDARRERGDLLDFVGAALRGGVDIVQLRDKGSVGERRFGALEAREEVRLVRELRELAHAHGALCAVNDRADVARAARADVLHLGQDDLPVHHARDIVGPDMVIGRSTHAVEEARAAAVEPGVDYFCTGPCWPTPTKPGRPAPGLDLVRATGGAAPTRPWFAIGGIDLDRVREVAAAGAERIVVVRAITEAADPAAAAHELRSELQLSGTRR